MVFRNIAWKFDNADNVDRFGIQQDTIKGIRGFYMEILSRFRDNIHSNSRVHSNLLHRIYLNKISNHVKGLTNRYLYISYLSVTLAPTRIYMRMMILT